MARYGLEDDQGRPLIFDKPTGESAHDLDPVQVIMAKRHHFGAAWNRRLSSRHVEAYQKLGLVAAADPQGQRLTLTDQAGADITLQKTATGVAVTTGEGRRFQYDLTRCKHPSRIVDPAGHAIAIDIQQRQNQAEPQPGENLVDAIRMEEGQKTYVFEYDDMDHLRRIDYPDGRQAETEHDAYGHLIQYTDRNGHTTRFTRDFDERLTELTDANGHTTRFAYQGLTAPEKITFADGAAFGFSYREDGVPVAFLSKECLIRNKTATGRPKDREDLRRLTES